MSTINRNVFLDFPPARAMLTELRDRTTDSERVEVLLRRLGYFLAIRATGGMTTSERQIETPLGSSGGVELDECALIPILRAGLGILPPFREFLPRAHVWDVGVVRDEATAISSVYVSKIPKEEARESLAGLACFILDPMFATGGSVCLTIQLLKDRGANNIIFVCVLAAPEGIERVRKEHPDVAIFIGRTDGKLNERKYICGFGAEEGDGDGNGAGDIGDRLRNS